VIIRYSSHIQIEALRSRILPLLGQELLSEASFHQLHLLGQLLLWSSLNLYSQFYSAYSKS